MKNLTSKRALFDPLGIGKKLGSNLTINPKGTPESRARDQAEIAAQVAKENAPPPMPDLTDAAIRQKQADALKELMGRRGRSYTLMSGATGDNTKTPLRRAAIQRLA